MVGHSTSVEIHGTGDGIYTIRYFTGSDTLGVSRDLSGSITNGQVVNRGFAVCSGCGTTSVGESPGRRGIKITVGPNPAREVLEVWLSPSISGPGSATDFASVRVFDVSGRSMGTLYVGTLGASSRHIQWNPRRDGRGGLPSGSYFVTVAVGGRTIATQSFVWLN